MMKKILLFVFLFIGLQHSYCQTEKYKSIDGTNISYLETDKNDLTLIFIHGWCCNKQFWKFQLPHFENKYHIVVLDLAGYGLSDTREQHSFDKWGEDILSVVDFLNIKKYILIGHSSGGYAILNAAVKADDRLLAIVGVDSYRGKIKAEFSVEYARNAEENNRLKAEEFRKQMRDIDRWFSDQSDPSIINWIKDQMEVCSMETAAQGIREYYLYRNKTTDDFKSLKCKVFGINKTKSPFDIDFFNSNNIEFKPFYIENVGHFVMMEDPENFNRILDEIINRLIE
jgi:pimeloyl-ACP methyl ester carboxylesterase